MGVLGTAHAGNPNCHKLRGHPSQILEDRRVVALAHNAVAPGDDAALALSFGRARIPPFLPATAEQ
eukprot:12096560-Alexandrium_andersonii.AAC.1